MINKLLDLEKDLRLSEECHAFCVPLGLPRNMNNFRDEGWFELMEEQGFLVDGRFLPIMDIIHKTENMAKTERLFVLESVGCDLSVAADLNT